jgi:drug/metabolite transporter (DMT)-like permease
MNPVELTPSAAEAAPESLAAIQPGRARLVYAYLALVAGIGALSFSALFVRWSQAPGTVTSFYRMVVAVVVLFPIFLRRPRPALGNRSLWLLPVLGGIFTAFDHASWSTALGMISIANATLINNIAPLWVGLFSFLILRQKLGGKFWLGLVLTLAGAGVVFGIDLEGAAGVNQGGLLALASSGFYAGYFLITQRGRRFWDSLAYIWLVSLTSAIVLLGVNLSGGQPLAGFSTQTYLSFLGAGLISHVIGYISVGYALGRLPASVVAPTMILQPVITALMAIPLAGEALALPQLAGGLAVLGGIYLVNLSQQPRAGREQQV